MSNFYKSSFEYDLPQSQSRRKHNQTKSTPIKTRNENDNFYTESHEAPPYEDYNEEEQNNFTEYSPDRRKDDLISYKDKEEDENLYAGEGAGAGNRTNALTLNYISVCQFCKNSFNTTAHLPYLFKCGHFFCKKCIVEKFTNKKTHRVECPEDASVSGSINDLKVLHNLILDSPEFITIRDIHEPTQSSRRVETGALEVKDNYHPTFSSKSSSCIFHPDQKLSHVIEDTGELICIYCAYKKVKENPRIEIKEIKEKYSHFSQELDAKIQETKNAVFNLEKKESEVITNFKKESSKIEELFATLFTLLEKRKEAVTNDFNAVLNKSVDELREKRHSIDKILEELESVKLDIDSFLYENQPNEKTLRELLKRYENSLKSFNKMQNQQSKYGLKEAVFSHEDKSEIMFGNLNEFKSVIERVVDIKTTKNLKEHQPSLALSPDASYYKKPPISSNFNFEFTKTYASSRKGTSHQNYSPGREKINSIRESPTLQKVDQSGSGFQPQSNYLSNNVLKSKFENLQRNVNEVLNTSTNNQEDVRLTESAAASSVNIDGGFSNEYRKDINKLSENLNRHKVGNFDGLNTTKNKGYNAGDRRGLSMNFGVNANETVNSSKDGNKTYFGTLNSNQQGGLKGKLSPRSHLVEENKPNQVKSPPYVKKEFQQKNISLNAIPSSQQPQLSNYNRFKTPENSSTRKYFK